MNWTQIALSSLATFIVLAALAVGGGMYAWSSLGGEALAAGWRMHGLSREERRAAWCADDAGTFGISLITPFVEAELGLDEAQRSRWDALVSGLEKEADTLRDPLCALDEDASAPDRMEQMRQALDAGARSIERIAPQLQAFYASLDAAQRRTLDTALAERRGRHGGWQ